MSPVTLLAPLDAELFQVETGSQADGLNYRCPYLLAYEELFPIVLAPSLWDHQWSAKRVEFSSDNTAVVKVLRSGRSRDSNLMVLLCRLSLLAARHSLAFTACHIPGKSNAMTYLLMHLL